MAHLLPGLFQQRRAAGGPPQLGVPELHPGGVAIGQPPLRLLIGEPGQTAQVAPVDAGRISPVSTGQVAADGCRHGGRQGHGADPNPSLPVSRTASEHHTGFMPVAAHGVQHRRLGMVQVDQDIAGVAVCGKRLKVNVITFAIAYAQETHGGWPTELRGGPQAFPGEGQAGGVMDEAHQIELAGHAAQLPPNNLGGGKQSRIAHRAPFQSKKRPAVQCVRSTMTSMHPPGQRGKNLAVNSACCISRLSQKRAQSMQRNVTRCNTKSGFPR